MIRDRTETLKNFQVTLHAADTVVTIDFTGITFTALRNS